MALYGVEKGTPGILVAPNGERKNFRTRRDLLFEEGNTSGPFEGLYIFERNDYVIYIAPEHVSISPVEAVEEEDLDSPEEED